MAPVRLKYGSHFGSRIFQVKINGIDITIPWSRNLIRTKEYD